MRIRNYPFSSVLVLFLVALFVAVSFDAYACFLPMDGTDGMGCPTSDEPQSCDAFETLGLESADKFPLHKDCQMIRSEDTVSSPLLFNLISHRNLLSDHPTFGLSKDLLLEISVIRV